MHAQIDAHYIPRIEGKYGSIAYTLALISPIQCKLFESLLFVLYHPKHTP